MLSAKQDGIKSLVWLDLGLNPGLPDHWRTLYSLGQRSGPSDISARKQYLLTKHNKDTNKLKSFNIRKILINNTKIIYENNHKNHLQILEAITIKKPKNLL